MDVKEGYFAESWEAKKWGLFSKVVNSYTEKIKSTILGKVSQNEAETRNKDWANYIMDDINWIKKEATGLDENDRATMESADRFLSHPKAIQNLYREAFDQRIRQNKTTAKKHIQEEKKTIQDRKEHDIQSKYQSKIKANRDHMLQGINKLLQQAEKELAKKNYQEVISITTQAQNEIQYKIGINKFILKIQQKLWWPETIQLPKRTINDVDGMFKDVEREINSLAYAAKKESEQESKRKSKQIRKYRWLLDTVEEEWKVEWERESHYLGNSVSYFDQGKERLIVRRNITITKPCMYIAEIENKKGNYALMKDNDKGKWEKVINEYFKEYEISITKKEDPKDKSKKIDDKLIFLYKTIKDSKRQSKEFGLV